MEPILQEQDNKYTLFPIDQRYLDIWNLYKKSISNFWTVEEVNLEKDYEDFKTLSESEQHFIKNILAFFAGSDGIVNENLVTKFYDEIQVAEIRQLYATQICIEAIHSEMYSLLIDTLIKDPLEKSRIFDGIATIPSVQNKAKWAQKWITNGSFAERLVAFLIVEGVFFASSFCAIYWIKTRNLLPGLCKSNEWIARDEGMHASTAAMIYNKLQNKLPENVIQDMFVEAINIEKLFVDESLPKNLIGMNAKMMKEYVEFVADYWLDTLGCKKVYNTKCPFQFMERLAIENKQDFFVNLPSNYQTGVPTNNFAIQDDDF